MANNYYWRAVRRLAKRHDVTVSRARRMDWEKEANAERKRRSIAHLLETTPVRRKGTGPTRTGGGSVSSVPRSAKKVPPPKRTTGTRPVPSRVPASKLKIRDYDRVRVRDEEELEDEEDAADEWTADWETDYPELDDLDGLEDFLEDFEYQDDDKYKEPA